MKCFLVVNQLNDPFYIDYDDGFARHIIKVSKEKGLIEESAVITELDANLVMQLFSPLVLSQWLLIDQTKEPCSSVSCPNGFIFVFKHVDGLLFLTINGDGTESEEFLHRKTQIFIRFMKFLFGPVSEEIGESQYSNKKSKWDFLRSLMKTWSELVASEQAFLVEAIERLNVNQLVSEKCIEILERAVKQIQAVQDQPTQHAVLLVNSKLLALYSNRNAHELRPKDILSLIVLSKTLYPQSDRLEDLFSKPYGGSSKKTYNSNMDENSDGLEDEYHSAPATPAGEFRSRTSSVKSGHAGETVTYCQQDEKAGSISMSDTETIINSLVNLSAKDEFAAFPTSCGTEKTLIDMYKEKYHDANLVEDDIETDGTETTQEIIVTNQVVVADVHNEQGKDFTEDSLRDKAELSNNERDSPLSAQVSKGQTTLKSGRSLDKREDISEPPSGASADSHSLLSSVDEVKDRSRASTVSSDRGEGSIVEESSLQSLRSTTSSVVSNFSNSYPALSLQTDTSSVTVTLPPVSLEQSEVKDHVKADLSSSQDNRGVRQRPVYDPSPTSTMERSFYMVDTMPSLAVPRGKGNGAYLPQTVFLESTTCQFSPHNIHTAQVLPGVTILFLSQAPRTIMADPLYQVMSNIQDLIFGRRTKLPRSRSLHVYEIINSLLSKLHNSLRKFKGRERHLISDIHSRWEKEDVKHKLLEYLEKESSVHIPPEVESPLTEMYKKLRELFTLLFLYPPPENRQLKESLSQLRVAINAELLDYREYLNVKSQRNITMTSYFDKFPGLVYFIFVDRRLHQMTAPSLNISFNDGEEVNASSYLKGNIWRMHQVMMKKVMAGYTTVLLREGDFYYSYFLWFEDSAGNPLPVQENFKPSNNFTYPGILCGSFYKELLLQCFPQVLMNSVFCYEMFLMHVGCIHPQYIATQCKRLAAELWEMSGDAYSTLNLF